MMLLTPQREGPNQNARKTFVLLPPCRHRAQTLKCIADRRPKGGNSVEAFNLCPGAFSQVLSLIRVVKQVDNRGCERFRIISDKDVLSKIQIQTFGANSCRHDGFSCSRSFQNL